MDVQNIEKRILESARAEAETITRQAEEKARDLLESARASNEERAREAVEGARQALQQQHDQQVTSAKAADKLQLLARRAGILDEVFEKAVERFIGDRGGEYRKWLSARTDSVAGESGTVVPAEPDRPLIEELLSTRDTGPTLAEKSLPLRGGFMLEGDRFDLDLSLDTQLVERKTELLPELAKKAFTDAD